KQKELAWQSIYKNEAKIIIGSRSALFAPFQSLSHIIIDEEHDGCYKQDQAPRYNAIDVAVKMAELLGIKVIMGSATPSLESYHKAKTGEYELIELIERPTKENLTLPKAKIVDLREEIKKKNFSIFSETLQEKLCEKLDQREQSILFLNRRGAASAVICRTCGFVVNCQNCEIPLTYHKKITVEDGIHCAERLICHHCGIIKKVPATCPQCDSHYIKFIGLGTQRVEEEIQKLYPTARILRADRDTTLKRDQFAAIYESFKKHQADILVGTQMIAIGLHLPKVNLVGIVMADTGLTIPNFRSSERTFQLITQVAGRAGREDQGQAIIQTYLPNHYAIVCAASHDYKSFYRKEISLREEMKNPPFSNLIKLTFKDAGNKKAMDRSLQIFRELEKANQGAAVSENNPVSDETPLCTLNHYPSLIPRLHNQYRWHILLSGAGTAPSDLLRKVKNLGGAIIDVDPLSTV
ncbi:primosomal protein N', partial [Patescibacteria group bacterium]|nr:primosomal protein N' [Patescibacteria group bacterium]